MKHKPYTTIEEAMQYLQVGDIVLMRVRTNDFFHLMARQVTGSYWTHAAMVFETIEVDGKVISVSVVEARDTIEVHRFDTYMKRQDIDIGIKRYPGLTQDEREKIRGFFLDALDITYDYSYIVAYFFIRLFRQLFGWDFSSWIVRVFSKNNNFICTTLVQRAMYLAADPGVRRKTIMNDKPEQNFAERLTLVSPRTIAKSTNTIWLYNPHI